MFGVDQMSCVYFRQDRFSYKETILNTLKIFLCSLFFFTPKLPIVFLSKEILITNHVLDITGSNINNDIVLKCS